ncbi:MAG: TonB-dependent receptor plug domain-containing protein, partial [Spirosomaceae bacterium]|nr:TonB-dependent receptor plug domain-containing protein [Spirosomataceae bacterium]
MQKTLLTFFVFLLGFASVQAQQKVTGKVLDETGSGLPGVSITVKGSTTGTNTDNDGNFSINAAPNSVLSFSFIGYEPQEVKVGNKSVINVSMEQSSAILDEVIVTTFGTAKKESFTGSAGQIGAQQIAVRPITNIGQAIAGTTAGVTTTAGSGQPGTAPEIRIRGFGSISSSNDPLYVVDGVPYSASIANLNPDDIATITILKDAASTALYGAGAANGVVMVTTKKGKPGESKINVKFTNGQNTRGLQEYERVGAQEYYPLMWEQFRNNQVYRAS